MSGAFVYPAGNHSSGSASSRRHNAAASHPSLIRSPPSTTPRTGHEPSKRCSTSRRAGPRSPPATTPWRSAPRSLPRSPRCAAPAARGPAPRPDRRCRPTPPTAPTSHAEPAQPPTGHHPERAPDDASQPSPDPPSPAAPASAAPRDGPSPDSATAHTPPPTWTCRSQAAPDPADDDTSPPPTPGPAPRSHAESPATSDTGHRPYGTAHSDTPAGRCTVRRCRDRGALHAPRPRRSPPAPGLPDLRPAASSLAGSPRVVSRPVARQRHIHHRRDRVRHHRCDGPGVLRRQVRRRESLHLRDLALLDRLQQHPQMPEVDVRPLAGRPPALLLDLFQLHAHFGELLHGLVDAYRQRFTAAVSQGL